MRHIDDDERRSRLAVRHGLHPAHRLPADEGAARLTTWLDGVRITNVYASALMKHARLP